MKRYIPLMLAVIVLISAAIYGNYLDIMDAEVVKDYYRQAVPTASYFKFISDSTAEVYGENDNLTGYIGVGTDVGYGGPLVVATFIDLEGNIQSVTIVDHKETSSFIDRIERKGYFKQYETKTVRDSLLPMYDIDCVSGATLSTRAIGNSVREAAHSIAASQLNTAPQRAKLDWKVGIQEIAVALLFVAGLVLARFKKLAEYRIGLLLASVVILGFWLNRSASIAQISALFLGYFPAPQTNLIWYMVLIGAVIPALFTGKNTYCTYFCPFCGLQEVTHLLSKTNLSAGKYSKWIRIGRDVVLFTAIFIAFITLNPSKASFEPFSTMFGLNGSKFGWYLLFTVLVISFFFKRFWCRAFCPVGAFLDKIAMISRDCQHMLGLNRKESEITGKKKTEIVNTKIQYKGNKEHSKEDRIQSDEENNANKSNVLILLFISYIALALCVFLVLKNNLL